MVTASDRRYAAIECSQIHRNDSNYFTALADACFNQECFDAFYTYLLDFPAVPLNVIPQTALRTQLQQISQPAALKFIQAVLEDNYLHDLMAPPLPIDEVADPVHPVAPPPPLSIPASKLFDHFVVWCAQNGEKSKSSTNFGNLLQNHPALEKKRNTKGKYYIITFPVPPPHDDEAQ